MLGEPTLNKQPLEKVNECTAKAPLNSSNQTIQRPPIHLQGPYYPCQDYSREAAAVQVSSAPPPPLTRVTSKGDVTSPACTGLPPVFCLARLLPLTCTSNTSKGRCSGVILRFRFTSCYVQKLRSSKMPLMLHSKACIIKRWHIGGKCCKITVGHFWNVSLINKLSVTCHVI